jgi:hypothetical protein
MDASVAIWSTSSQIPLAIIVTNASFLGMTSMNPEPGKNDRKIIHARAENIVNFPRQIELTALDALF